MKEESGSGRIRIDVILLLILVIANLEINLNSFFDPLQQFEEMTRLPLLQKLFVPGGVPHPLVILGNQFAPLKLLVRSLATLLLLCYLLIGLFCRHPRRRDNGSRILIWALAGLLVLLPTLLTIHARISGSHHELAHDGGTIQVEEAVRIFLHGGNPYRQTYLGTPLENWRGFHNNAVYHYPYLPFSFLFAIPFYLPLKILFGWYDQRLLHLFCYLAAIVIAGRFPVPRAQRRAAMIWVALNPLVTKYFVLGVNDIVLIFWLLLAWLLLRKGRHRAAMPVVAAACSTKQFALLLLPFLLVYWWRDFLAGRSWRNRIAFLRPLWITLLALTMPFFLWSPTDFIADTVLYSSGGLPTSYPIQGFHGYGVGTFLLFFRAIPHGNVRFPFWIFQILLVLPVFCLLLRRPVGRDPAPLFLNFSIVLFLFLFFSRYLHGNFFGFLAAWPVLAWLLTVERPEPLADHDGRECIGTNGEEV